MASGHVSVLGTLKGGSELRARLKAIGGVFKPLGRAWAKEAVSLGQPKVPVKTGRLRRSIRVKSATDKKAVVGAHYTAYFIDAGARYPAFRRRGNARAGIQAVPNNIFRKRGFRMQPRPFRAYIAHEALRRRPFGDAITRAWNDAA
jgi:hypothetical protein